MICLLTVVLWSVWYVACAMLCWYGLTWLIVLLCVVVFLAVLLLCCVCCVVYVRVCVVCSFVCELLCYLCVVVVWRGMFVLFHIGLWCRVVLCCGVVFG